ncbi:SDR family NAD(P)-dependent oxidoreductase [Microbacter margulisiae]|uniref:NADP-dependent 3-hydroxy acid dehydrogenase YdfG n=1 Tax=Microbacter margulisiae TaxID=1350067 RepID=A0A7W5DTR7_9PORP|nr:SDR family NAD(P)-dependent oxidoreductase [Microbacter margulisiae]MBB3188424.1 NADP-dependent 3-hydroxy acid dehydrogenase YdfG [Microbacter margulisiae]
MSTKTAFITGTTSGFGLAIANRLASLGCNLIITGRRRERLETEAADIRSHYGVEVLPLCFDVRDREVCRQTVESLPERWKQIDLLINNAGLAAGATPVQDGDIDDWERMIDTNVKGLLYISRFVIPLMVKRKSGHVINISSIAGVEVYPSGNVYCATKHAVNAITKGMRIDLLKENIKVSSISPGAAETEFSLVRYHGDQEKADAVYKGIVPLNAEDIADAVEFIVTRPPHVNINDILLTPVRQANTYVYHREG